MTLKKVILEVMDRDDLKVVIDDFELECADRRSREEMDGLISRSRRVAPSDLLQYLSESQVKQVCERLGVDGTGRRGQLIHRLLGTKPATSKRSLGGRRKRPEEQAKSIVAGSEAISQQSIAQPIRLTDAPPGMLRVTKTELVWPGKYNDDGTLKSAPKVSLPFQVIESINQSRASREARKRGIQGTLFDVYDGNEGSSFDAGWVNKLIWGDNALVMASLLSRFAGKIDLVYIDPPFATGADFSFLSQIGDTEIELQKDQSAIEEKAYRDTWGAGLVSYLSIMLPRLHLIRELLSPGGTLFLHLDRHVSQPLRMLCDEVFGADHFVNDITWKRSHAHGDAGQGATHFGRVTESILVYTKAGTGIWEPQYVPYSDEIIERDYKHIDQTTGERYRLMPVDGPGGGAKGNPYYEFQGISGYWRYSRERMQQLYAAGEVVVSSTGRSLSRKRYLKDAKGTPVTDLWDDVNRISPTSLERLGYPTQKPESLLERIIKTASIEGSIVADFFCGSGTTLAVAETLGRRWIGCDLGRWSVHVTRKRLLEIQGCKPFEVLNLGRYERQYWQGVRFGVGGTDSQVAEQAIYEYFSLILKLYGAQPVAGMVNVHGKKERALVHVGAVDAPVTISEIDAAVDECSRVKQPELHVLGWEWEMGLHDLMVEAAKKKGVKLLLLQIPREVMEQQAAANGDVRFFELAYLEAEISQPKKLAARVTLQDFVIQNSELIPDDVRSKVKKWSDYIDYWAIDWDFRNDTFLQGWVAYRTRKDRSLPLASDPHTYPKPGKYRILVKVIDIFGNDTSQAFDVEIKG